MEKYQWEKNLDKQGRNINEWTPKFGPITTKTSEGLEITFQVYNPHEVTLHLVGPFNNWGEDLKGWKLENKNNFSYLKKELPNKTPYKFLINKEKMVQDPASHYFDDKGNSMIWHLPDKKPRFQQDIDESTRILQTSLPGLIVHYMNEDGVKGHQVEKENYYKFIKESGVIHTIKELGFNAVQFLPFAQSIDGDNWKYRYLVPFQYSIQKNWGNPTEFREMVEAFHDHGISVIGDFVLGHLPYKDYEIFGQDHDNNGLHVWKNDTGMIYLDEETSWGTKRINYDDPLVREFFISSVLHFMKKYNIDGMRVDNVDGIIRHGDAGRGEERTNGRTFLRELNQSIYEYNPEALISYEAHYFHEDNDKMLVAPFEEDERALGATAYNSSRLTYYFHTEVMPKSGDDITAWKFKHINEEKQWGKSNSTLADFHNHDAAAGLMEMRATGSYAYNAMTVSGPHNHVHALGKIKVMEAIISFCCEGRTLDLLQTFILQDGTFEHDSSIQWGLTQNPVNENLLTYKKEINEILKQKPFWPINVDKRKYLNVDDKNKILVMERKSDDETYVIVINLTSQEHIDYKVGVTSQNDYELIMNSDRFQYAGLGMTNYPHKFKNQESNTFEYLEREISLPKIPPYGVIVLKEVTVEH